MKKRSNRYLLILCCIAYLLQPFAALASNIDRIFHEEFIGVTVEYGNGTQVQQLVISQLDNDILSYNHEFSDGTKYYGTNIEDNSSSSIAVIISLPTVSTIFETSYKYFLPKNHFKSIPKTLEIRPPIFA